MKSKGETGPKAAQVRLPFAHGCDSLQVPGLWGKDYGTILFGGRKAV